MAACDASSVSASSDHVNNHNHHHHQQQQQANANQLNHQANGNGLSVNNHSENNANSNTNSPIRQPSSALVSSITSSSNANRQSSSLHGSHHHPSGGVRRRPSPQLKTSAPSLPTPLRTQYFQQPLFDPPMLYPTQEDHPHNALHHRVHAPPPPKRTPLHLSIMSDMSRLYHGEAIPADFIIRTGKVTHRAHRFVLMFRSRYFESLFRSGFQESTQNEMKIDDVDPDVMAAILKYLYLGVFSCQTMDQLIDLLIVADRFLLEELVSALTEAILRNIEPDNALQLYQIADQYNFRAIFRKVKQYIYEHGFLMLRELSFLNLSEKELGAFLGKDRFCSIEDEIALFLLRYIKRHQLENNEQKCSELMGLIRFPMIVDMDALLPTLLAKANSIVFHMLMGKFHEADRQFRASPDGLKSLPFRHCYHASKLKLKYNQFSSLLDNGVSTIVSMAPCSIVLTLSRKTAFDRINFYVRCVNSIHCWFEWTPEPDDEEQEEEDGKNGGGFYNRGGGGGGGGCCKYVYNNRSAVANYNCSKPNEPKQSNSPTGSGAGGGERVWHSITGSNAWGNNRSFQIELPQVQYAKYIRVQLHPVANDVGSFPLSIYNLCFSLLFPYNDVLPVGDGL